MEKFENQLEQDNYLNYTFDRKVDEWLQKPHELHEIEQDGIYDYFTNLKNEYLLADKEFQGSDKEKLLSKYKRHIGQVRSRFDDSIELRDHVSFINNNPEQQGNNWRSFKLSNIGQEIASAMSGEKELSWKNNFAGYMIGDEFMSLYDIRKLVDKKIFDLPSRNLIGSVIEYAQVLGSYENAGELNMKDIEFKVRNEIVQKGNRESLINDNHIQTEGGSFRIDMINRLQQMKYEDLGISENMIQNIDKKLDSVKTSDGINEDEAIIIYEELMKNKEMTDDYLTAYFSQHVKSHYDHVRPQKQNIVATKPEQYKKGSI
tara:strand:+ start:9066 stop:10016 length:951 start_codon:yes stop_codon:yes gene_type:complete